MRFLVKVSCLFSLVCCIIPSLFGGGCLLENDNLIFTSGFTLPERRILDSYKLNINNIIGNSSQLIEWQVSSTKLTHPGDLKPVLYKDNQHILVYVMGGFFIGYQIPQYINTNIQRRDEGAPTLARTSLVKYSKAIAPDPELYYLQQLETNLRIGAYYENKLFILENLQELNPYNTPLEKISVYDFDKNETRLVTTKGEFPINKPGFSATQDSKNLIITGGKSSDSMTDNVIYILNLETLTWESHTVTGLIGASNGCLYLHNDLLIHAFGIYKDQPSPRTQLIDVKLWKLIENYTNNDPKSLGMPVTSIILAVVGSLCALALILAGFFYYRWRRRREANKIEPPNFISTAVWTELETKQFQADMELSTNDPDGFYDTTLSSPLNTLCSSRDTMVNN